MDVCCLCQPQHSGSGFLTTAVNVQAGLRWVSQQEGDIIEIGTGTASRKRLLMSICRLHLQHDTSW